MRATTYDLSKLDEMASQSLREQGTRAWFNSRPDLRDAILDRFLNRNYPQAVIHKYLKQNHEYPYHLSSCKKYLCEIKESKNKP